MGSNHGVRSCFLQGIGYAYLLDTGVWPRAAGLLKQYPGIVYAAASLLLVGFSVLLFADPGGLRKRWQTLLLRVPCGIAAMASGAWQIADPQGFAQVERQVRARLDDGYDRMKHW